MKTHRKARGLRKDDKSKAYVKNRSAEAEMPIGKQALLGDADEIRKIEELEEDKFRRGIK